MQKSSIYLALGLLLAGFISFNSCTKKVNGVNNDQVIETPYSLFFSDTAGALFKTNDGHTVENIVHPDGYPHRAICTDLDKVLYIKNNLYVSTNNGKNFNHGYDSVTAYPFMACNGLCLNLNQSMVINIPDWRTTFVASGYVTSSQNYMGVALSLFQGGIKGFWWDDLPDTPASPGAPVAIGYFGDPPYTIRITSFTLLKNGVLCGYDGPNNRCFYRTQNTLWNECTANPDSVAIPGVGMPVNHSGIPLPHRQAFAGGTFPIDTTAFYSYGHYNNRLIAIDNINCNNSAYYSDDTGRNWTKYNGLPNKPLLCIASPFEEICLIGTDSAGLYFLNRNTGEWQQQTNSGLGKYLVVRNIAFKENIYKNGVKKNFIYLATNQGIYQSTDGGNNWTMTIPGNFVCVY